MSDVTIKIDLDSALFLLWVLQNNGSYTDTVWNEYHNKLKQRG